MSSNVINTYSPFIDVLNNKFQIINAILIKMDKQANICLNNYVLHRQIGKGSYAQVRLAHDILNEEDVALRIVNRKQLSKKLGPRKSDQMIATYLKALSILDFKYVVQLKEFLYTNILLYDISQKVQKTLPISHELARQFYALPQIIGDLLPDEDIDDDSIGSSTPRFVQSTHNMQNSCVFVFEKADGSLSDLANKLSYKELRQYMFQVAQCLHHMHENRVAYNDLKPENILFFESQQRVKLSDFDTSFILDDNKLNYSSLQLIFSPRQLEGIEHVVVDPLLEQHDFVADVICTPAIASPEVRQAVGIYSAIYSDVWQYGQLLLRIFLDIKANVAVPRGSDDYVLIAESYNEDLADLIAGCTAAQAARYDSRTVLLHPFFTLQQLSEFRRRATQLKRQQVLAPMRRSLRSCSAMARHNHASLSMLNGLLALYNAYVSPLVVKVAAGQAGFGTRQLADRVQQLRNALESVLKGRDSGTCRSKSVMAPHNKLPAINTKEIYQGMDADTIKAINDDKLASLVIDTVELGSLKGIFCRQGLYNCLFVIQLFNYVIRFANFHLLACPFAKESKLCASDCTGCEKSRRDAVAHVQKIKARSTSTEDTKLSKSLLSIQDLSKTCQSNHTATSLKKDGSGVQSTSLFQAEEAAQEVHNVTKKGVTMEDIHEWSNDSADDISDIDLPCRYKPQQVSKKPQLSFHLNLAGGIANQVKNSALENPQQPPHAVPEPQQIQVPQLGLDIHRISVIQGVDVAGNSDKIKANVESVIYQHPQLHKSFHTQGLKFNKEMLGFKHVSSEKTADVGKLGYASPLASKGCKAPSPLQAILARCAKDKPLEHAYNTNMTGLRTSHTRIVNSCGNAATVSHHQPEQMHLNDNHSAANDIGEYSSSIHSASEKIAVSSPGTGYIELLQFLNKLDSVCDSSKQSSTDSTTSDKGQKFEMMLLDYQDILTPQKNANVSVINCSSTEQSQQHVDAIEDPFKVTQCDEAVNIVIQDGQYTDIGECSSFSGSSF